MKLPSWLSGKAAPSASSSIFVGGMFNDLPQNIKAYVTEGYGQNPVVNACVSIIATAGANVKLEMHSLSEGGDKKVDLNHPVLAVLAQPNPMQTWEEFALEMIAWHRVAGEVFILRLPEKGQPKELHILNPEMMNVKASEFGNLPKAYEYGDGEKKRIFPVNLITGVSQVLHIKTFNPTNPWRGLSPLSPAARAADMHNNGARWNSALLANSARPSGVIEIAGTVMESTLSQLREYFKKAWQGVQNAGNMPLLTGGAKFTPLSHNPKDMDFKGTMEAAAKDIGLVYGVPLPLLTMEAATFSNMDAAQERLWTDTVLPLLNQIVKKLSQFLVPLYGDVNKTIQLAYNADSVPALEPKRERMFKRMAAAVGGGLLTPNEARAEMGYDAMEHGDTLYMPGSLKPIGEETTAPKDLAKAMKAAGYTPAEIVDAIGTDYGIKKAA